FGDELVQRWPVGQLAYGPALYQFITKPGCLFPICMRGDRDRRRTVYQLLTSSKVASNSRLQD
ncbi:MAG: hypothetical protein ACHQ7M_15755, partial [Chloroflexota bacterium]